MKIFYGRDFIEHPCTPEHNTVPEQHGLTLLIYWYLQHAAVNDTKTHGHRHLSSISFRNICSPAPPTHTLWPPSDGQACLLINNSYNTSTEHSAAYGQFLPRDKKLLPIWEHTFGRVHSLLSSLPYSRYTGACCFWRKTAAPMRSLCANLYSPRPGISSKITLWILCLSKSCQSHLCPLLTFPTAMRHLHRAKAAELLAHQFWLCIQMPLHFFTFQQIKPHIPLGLSQWCHQPHHSEGSCQMGLVVGDIPENSPKCCWDTPTRDQLTEPQEELPLILKIHKSILALSFSTKIEIMY